MKRRQLPRQRRRRPAAAVVRPRAAPRWTNAGREQAALIQEAWDIPEGYAVFCITGAGMFTGELYHCASQRNCIHTTQGLVIFYFTSSWDEGPGDALVWQ